MKLEAININNVLGISEAHISIRKPILLVWGANAAGKSSIAEAVRQAITNEPTRVDHKKEYSGLVHEGASVGTASVEWNGGSAMISLPDGTHKVDGLRAELAMPILLDPARFAAMDSKERRSFLFRLMGVKITKETVLEKMIERGCDETMSKEIAEYLPGGMETAQNKAKEFARDAKAAWRTITGETYGPEKAKSWKANCPDYDNSAIESAYTELKMIDSFLAETREKVGGIKQRLLTSASQQSTYALCKEKAAGLKKAKELVSLAEKEIAEHSPKLEALRAKAGGQKLPCPPLMHTLADLVQELRPVDSPEVDAVLAEYDKNYRPDSGDADAQSRLPEYEKAQVTLENMLSNRQRDLTAAQVASDQLAAMEEPTSLDELEQELAQQTQGINELEAKQKEVLATKNIQESAKLEAAKADMRTNQASDYHKEVSSWDAIATALAQDGIPAEFLNQAIDPFNMAISLQATATGWQNAQLDDDMNLVVGFNGQPYRLCSESERWRADAMIASAIAQLSGARFLMLDRFDVLDTNGRVEAFYWLADLAEDGLIDSAIVLGTLKAIPKGLPDEFQAEWIQEGRLIHSDEGVAA